MLVIPAYNIIPNTLISNIITTIKNIVTSITPINDNITVIFIIHNHSMHPTLSAGTLKLLPNFLKEEGGLTGSHLLEGGAAGKEEVTFFRVGCSFYKKKKNN